METMEQGHKICSFCGEEINESQRRCPYCGSLVEIRNNVNGYTPSQMNQTQVYQVQENQPAANQPQYGQQDKNPQYRQPDVNTQYSQPDIKPQFIQPESSQPVSNNPQPNQAQAAQIQQNRANTSWGQQAAPRPKTMSNGLKVFLTALFLIIPGIGQLAGAITAIIMMSSDTDNDKKSFGTALLIASVLVFILTCSISFVLSLAIPMLY